MKSGWFLVVAALAAPVTAQDSAEPLPLPVQQQTAGNAVLPANTEVLLKMNQEVTTKGRTWSEGDTFNLTVVEDVTLGDYVVIPRGSKAVGRITWLTSRGAFGKSGKMDIELEHVEVSGRRVPLNGTYRQEGEGNTLATVGGVIAAGVFAGFITGHSGKIPQGRELMATTERDLELALPAAAVQDISLGVAPLAPQTAAASGPTWPATVRQPRPAVIHIGGGDQ
jgi:hypothetical protein